MEAEKPKVGNLAAVRRLPQYLHLLRQPKDNGREIVSSSYIAEKLKSEAIQVRKDLAITGIIGKPKVGYYIRCRTAFFPGRASSGRRGWGTIAQRLWPFDAPVKPLTS